MWLLSLVLLTAYLAFIGTYEFPAFAERAFDESEEFGAGLGTFRDWVRPVAAISAGLLADRIRVSCAVMGAFYVACDIRFSPAHATGPDSSGRSGSKSP